MLTYLLPIVRWPVASVLNASVELPSLFRKSTLTSLYVADSMASPALKRLRYRKTGAAPEMLTASACPHSASMVVTVTLVDSDEGGVKGVGVGGKGGGYGGGGGGDGGGDGGGLGQFSKPAGHPMQAAAAPPALCVQELAAPHPFGVLPLPAGKSTIHQPI